MGIYLERAKELRAIVQPHYNCAQGALVPFAERSGLAEEQAFAVAQGFGRGISTGNVCGACIGAVMALGALGIGDARTTASLVNRMKKNHGGVITCSELLRKCAEEGQDRHIHCDNMVFEAVSLVEEALGEAE